MNGKKLLPLIIVLFALSIMIYSCGSSDSNKINTSEVALHEYTFKDDPNLYAQFSHVTVLDFEHAQESNIHEKDSGSPGVDVIPYIVRQGGNHTLQLEDTGNEIYYAILRNENEEEVARIDANGTPVTAQLLPGKYKLYVHNIGTETFPLFLQPLTVDVGSMRQASYNFIEVAWFAMWGTCVSCDLSHANLSWTIWQTLTGGGVNLSKANLSYANLQGVQMRDANLSYANLSNASVDLADLTYSDLSHANLSNANLLATSMDFSGLQYANLPNADLSNSSLINSGLQYAKLTNAFLEYTDLSLADLTGADLSGADMIYAKLLGANLTDVNLSGADLSGATWTDGSTCAEGSWGRCIH